MRKEYGLERISATTGSEKTRYVYDGRGSVAQKVMGVGELGSAGDGSLTVASLAYTPFGVSTTQAAQESGYGFNREYYDGATGMLNLRARQYEPRMGRFGQKDILRGNVWEPRGLNRYAFVHNDPVNYHDPNGMYEPMADINGKPISIGQAKKKIRQEAQQYASSAEEAAKNKDLQALSEALDKLDEVQSYLSPEALRQYQEARKFFNQNKGSGNPMDEQAFFAQMANACRLIVESQSVVSGVSVLETRMNALSAQDWLFFSSFMFGDLDLDTILNILDRIKEQEGQLSQNDLIELGVFQEEDLPQNKWQEVLAFFDAGGVGNYHTLLMGEYQSSRFLSSFAEAHADQQQKMLAAQTILLAMAGYNLVNGLLYGPSGYVFNPDGLDGIEATGVDARGLPNHTQPMGNTGQAAGTPGTLGTGGTGIGYPTDASQANNNVGEAGKLTGDTKGLTGDERKAIDRLLEEGKNVEIIPRSNLQGESTPDFYVDGAKTELKTLNGTSRNTPVTRITDGFSQGGAQEVIIDASKTDISRDEALHIIERARGTYPDGLPGKVEIWLKDGSVVIGE